MALSIKHKFTSLKSDGVDNTRVQPSNWNDEHNIIMDAFTILGRGSGSGAGSGLSMDVVGVPLGIVLPWFASPSSVPANFLLCFGQQISTTTYADLFTLWGTTFGSGSGTFGVPDLRGRVLYGKDNMGGAAASRLQSSFGVDGATLGAVGGDQAAALLSHTHGVVDPGHVHTLQAGNAGLGGTGGGDVVQISGGPAPIVNGASTGITIASVGTATASRLVPGIVVNWIVKAKYT